MGGRGSGGGRSGGGAGGKAPSTVTGKNMTELKDNLKSQGLVLDSAYNRPANGEEVVMYKVSGGKIQDRYVGTYNRYTDGGRKIVNIKQRDLIQEIVIGGVRYDAKTGKKLK